MERLLIIAAFVTATAMVACSPGAGEGEGEGEGLEPTFTNVKSEVFSVGCAATGCHGTDPEDGIALNSSTTIDDLVDFDSVNVSGSKLVVAGDADASVLYQVLVGAPNADVRQMPLDQTEYNTDPTTATAVPLTQAEIDLVKDWINAGANDD
jgi:hypothetical protein